MPADREIAVFNTSPLIFLDVLDYLPLLPDLHQPVIPPAVSGELLAQPTAAGSQAPHYPWLAQRSPAVSIRDRVDRELLAGAGERQAIALALTLSSLVVLDDKKARAYARQCGIRLTGTVGLLLRLHRRGLSIRALPEDLALLETAGMRLSPAVRGLVLQSL